MQTPLTAKQEALLHTTCPVCNECELTAMDAIAPDEPFLWCANCDTTIDGKGNVEAGEVPEYCDDCRTSHRIDDGCDGQPEQEG